jgi:hypothetical protein
MTSPSGRIKGELLREGDHGGLPSRVSDCLVALALYLPEC